MSYLIEVSLFKAELLTVDFRVGLATPDNFRHARKPTV